MKLYKYKRSFICMKTQSFIINTSIELEADEGISVVRYDNKIYQMPEEGKPITDELPVSEIAGRIWDYIQLNYPEVSEYFRYEKPKEEEFVSIP